MEVEVPGLRWSAGTPDPFVVTTEDRALFAFIPSDDETTDSESSQDVYRVCEFVRSVSVRFGFPNDEALRPLFERDLAFYAVNLAIDSEWLDELRSIERSHPSSVPTPFASARHWVLPFHDSTVEALADEITVHGDYIGRAGALAAMATLCDLV